MSRTDRHAPRRLTHTAWDWWKTYGKRRYKDDQYDATDPRYWSRAKRERVAQGGEQA